MFGISQVGCDIDLADFLSVGGQLLEGHHLDFNSGAIASIGIAAEKANLVVA